MTTTTSKKRSSFDFSGDVPEGYTPPPRPADVPEGCVHASQMRASGWLAADLKHYLAGYTVRSAAPGPDGSPRWYNLAAYHAANAAWQAAQAAAAVESAAWAEWLATPEGIAWSREQAAKDRARSAAAAKAAKAAAEEQEREDCALSTRAVHVRDLGRGEYGCTRNACSRCYSGIPVGHSWTWFNNAWFNSGVCGCGRTADWDVCGEDELAATIAALAA